MTGRSGWARYLQQFHAERPGITEQAFRHATDERFGTPYQWLADDLPSAPGVVLDVACGNAALLPWLRGHDRYLGVDRSHAEVEHARRAGRGPVLRGDARRLPVPDASVDTVVSSMGLMLVQPLEHALAEMARVLRPGGSLALLLPSTWPIRAGDVALGLALSLRLHGPGSMPQQVTVARLQRAMSSVGMSVVRATRHRFPFALHDHEHARLAVRSLYTPGRSPRQLARAESLLAQHSGDGVELPVPLLRVLARRG